MSWSVTVDNLQDIRELPEEVYDKLAEDNPLYLTDATGAFRLAQDMGLASATLAGGRTPNPYAIDEAVVISIVGHSVASKFTETMQRTVSVLDEGYAAEVGDI